MFTASNNIKRNKNNKLSKRKLLNVIPMPQYAKIQKENESEARDIKELISISNQSYSLITCNNTCKLTRQTS